jgi:hypothetical protein
MPRLGIPQTPSLLRTPAFHNPQSERAGKRAALLARCLTGKYNRDGYVRIFCAQCAERREYNPATAHPACAVGPVRGMTVVYILNCS